MKWYMFLGILFTYLFLIIGTGYLAFIKYHSLSTLPSPQMTQRAETDSFYKEQLENDINNARDRRELLAKSASHSFDVILGALLGFMSAVAATKTGQVTKPDTDSSA